MGQKVSPTGLRIGINKDWESKWYAENDFAKYLNNDYKIRKYLNKKFKNAGISQIVVERNPKRCEIFIYAAKPGLIIGQSGVEIEKIKKEVAKLVNEGFFHDGGRIRGVPVSIGGTKYVPPLPIESQVIESINDILKSDKDKVDIAIDLCMYCMRTQVFLDGNKRASVIFANHFMISHGLGLIVIPENHVPEFKKKLVHYYESADIADINEFLKKKKKKKM